MEPRGEGGDISGLGYALLRLVAHADAFESTLSATLELVCETADWPYGEVWSPDDGGDALHLESTWCRDPSFEAFAAESADTTFERGSGLPGRVWRDGEPEWISDLSTATTETFARADAAGEYGFGAAVAVPVVAEDEVVAVLLFITDEYREADEAFVTAVADAAHQLGTLLTSARTRERLERERNAFEAVIENSPAPIIVVDADGTVSRVNRRFETLFDTTREVVVGRHVTDDVWNLYDATGEPLDATNGPSSIALREGRPVNDMGIELSVGDGERRALVANATPIFGDGDEPERVVTAYVDVTDQQTREAELEAKNAQLEAFASIVAHDLRNPLAVASGFMELARETGDLGHFDRVLRAHDRMSTLIADLLLLARQGRAIGERSDVDVGVVARSAWDGIDADDATLVVDPDVGTVSADTGRLTQLFENLFRNSVEHGGDGVTVRIGPLDDGEGFYVADDGPGIPEERRSVLLRNDEYGGLGLQIVAAIAEGHGWTVRFDDSDSGADSPGLRVEFHVDRAAPDDGETAASGESAEP